MKNYQIFLNVIATLIIGITVIGVLILSFNYLKMPSPEIKTIKIEYAISPAESKANQSNKKIDALLKDLKITSNKIQQRQLELIEDKSDDNFFNKLYTAIVAIILAIAGFFGFKSISEIKSQAIEDAKKEATTVAKEESTKISKIEARKIAKNEFINMFNDDYEAKVFAQANQAMNNFLSQEIGNLETRIFALEEQIAEMGRNNPPPVNLNIITPNSEIENLNEVAEPTQTYEAPNNESKNPFE